jgi:hypothetical protein
MRNSWVGMVSFRDSTSSAQINMTLIDKMLFDDKYIDKDVSVLAFLDISHKEQSLSMYMEDVCPGMMPILKDALEVSGEDPP